jgi:hypothetical protein
VFAVADAEVEGVLGLINLLRLCHRLLRVWRVLGDRTNECVCV